MATMIGSEATLLGLLKDLIELDYDAIEAYEAAIERMDDMRDRAQLSTFLADHRRHVNDLSLFMHDLGGTPPDGGDIKRILTKGKVVLGGLLGDRAVLTAMKTNEDDTNTAYERALKRNDIPARIRAVFQRNLADERRHRDWIVQRIRGYEASAHA
ncbi:PA2169 family four-helix-bundle protein [Chondromyces apiculatus]|uniref:DUF2383 domain-containing protein n=1 Tax=Chondromyces apiculatus DSM 436 TaxID=1192034 RepID=A0A017T4J6_9BACT|nr:PA2169 family four-helix-bundle protein [Chondromyces apiculatus]EYF04178.1 Hypothetical protein CAP_4861 [Chondromyces apiculatus DSM 436]